MAQNNRCISGDTHLEIPNERWTHRIDKKYRDRAPRTIRLEGGADATVFEDLPPRQTTFDIQPLWIVSARTTLFTAKCSPTKLEALVEGACIDSFGAGDWQSQERAVSK